MYITTIHTYIHTHTQNVSAYIQAVFWCANVPTQNRSHTSHMDAYICTHYMYVCVCVCVYVCMYVYVYVYVYVCLLVVA